MQPNSWHRWAEVIKAWADGKEVEMLENGEWVPFSGAWYSDDKHQYRVKPTPETAPYVYVYKLPGGAIELRANKETGCNWQLLGKLNIEVIHHGH